MTYSSSVSSQRSFGLTLIGLGLAAFQMAGCASLPSSGPTAHQIVKRSKDRDSTLRFDIVNLDARTVSELNMAQAQRIASATSLASLAGALRPITLGPGDILNISLYEVGASLFATQIASGSAGFDPSAHGEKFPQVVVDADGMIRLPYVGNIKATGLSPTEVEREIERRLANKSQNPQAMVSLERSVYSTVYVSGDANKPGRYDLTYGREHLLDAIAGSGGASASAEDTLVRFERGGATVDQRLGAIRAGAPDDLLLEPGDRIELIKRPRSFTVFGATAKVAQLSFETGAVTLAEAMARVQGPNDATADPTAIFVFRYDDSKLGVKGATPIIYRLNMMDPVSYFLAQRFAIQDKDVIYIANAAANQPSKFISIINQLFSPLVTARALSN